MNIYIYTYIHTFRLFFPPFSPSLRLTFSALLLRSVSFSPVLYFTPSLHTFFLLFSFAPSVHHSVSPSLHFSTQADGIIIYIISCESHIPAICLDVGVEKEAIRWGGGDKDGSMWIIRVGVVVEWFMHRCDMVDREGGARRRNKTYANC